MAPSGRRNRQSLPPTSLKDAPRETLNDDGKIVPMSDDEVDGLPLDSEGEEEEVDYSAEEVDDDNKAEEPDKEEKEATKVPLKLTPKCLAKKTTTTGKKAAKQAANDDDDSELHSPTIDLTSRDHYEDSDTDEDAWCAGLDILPGVLVKAKCKEPPTDLVQTQAAIGPQHDHTRCGKLLRTRARPVYYSWIRPVTLANDPPFSAVELRMYRVAALVLRHPNVVDLCVIRSISDAPSSIEHQRLDVTLIDQDLGLGDHLPNVSRGNIVSLPWVTAVHVRKAAKEKPKTWMAEQYAAGRLTLLISIVDMPCHIMATEVTTTTTTTMSTTMIITTTTATIFIALLCLFMFLMLAITFATGFYMGRKTTTTVMTTTTTTDKKRDGDVGNILITKKGQVYHSPVGSCVEHYGPGVFYEYRPCLKCLKKKEDNRLD